MPSASRADLERARLISELGLSESSPLSLQDLANLQAAQAAALTNQLGTLAYAENTTGVVTAVPANGNTVVPGTQIVVPPTNRDVWIEWEGLMVITTAGEGNLQLACYETTGAAVLRGAAVEACGATSPAATNSFRLPGKCKVGPSSSVRNFELRVSRFPIAASGLAANLYNGVAVNGWSTWITAEAR